MCSFDFILTYICHRMHDYSSVDSFFIEQFDVVYTCTLSMFELLSHGNFFGLQKTLLEVNQLCPNTGFK